MKKPKTLELYLLDPNDPEVATCLVLEDVEDDAKVDGSTLSLLVHPEAGKALTEAMVRHYGVGKAPKPVLH